jgi:predicted RNA methylase
MTSSVDPTLKAMWSRAEAVRDERLLGPVELLAMVVSGDIEGTITAETIRALLKTPSQRQALGQSFSSLPVTKFVSLLAGQLKPRSILDPTCGSGFMLQQAVHAASPSIIDAVEINAAMAEIARALLGDEVRIITGDIFASQSSLHGSYDMIIADAPLGLRLPKHPDAGDVRDSFETNDFAEALCLWCCERLAPSGLGVVLIANKTVGDQRFHDRVHKRGAAIKAFIHIPAGSLLGTSISAHIAVLEKGPQSDLFIAELSADPEHNGLVIKALLGQSPPSKRPSLGMRVPLTSFTSFKNFENNWRLDKLAREAGFHPVPAADVLVELVTVQKNATRLEDFDADRGDALLHRMARHLIQDPLRAKSKLTNYLRVRLNQEVVDPVFLDHWLRSDFGRYAIDAITAGSVIPSVSIAALRSATFYLPDLARQQAMVAVLQRLDGIKAEADEVAALCWEPGAGVTVASERIEWINREESFNEWVETLPFPLATILWRHHTAPDSAIIRFPILVDFFEAVAAFLATIHLSAFISDEDQWAAVQPKLMRALDNGNLSLSRATFGTWKCVCEVLASHARKLVRGEKERPVVNDMYCLDDNQVLELLLSSEPVTLLQNANKLRNTHMGHSGAMSEVDATKVENDLMHLVKEVRKHFGRAWTAYELVLGSKAGYRDGVFSSRVPRIMGTRSQFETVERQTTVPMEEGRLYMLSPSGDRGLSLLPFVRMGASPASEPTACYFFNRQEKEGVRFVSYHFDRHADLTDQFPDTESAIRKITTIETLPSGAP